jgi:pimeloyl-ACP methyl ester carboxylesterase
MGEITCDFVFSIFHISAGQAARLQEPATKPQNSALPYGQLIKVSPEPGKGFHWGYYLYLPKSLAQAPAKNQKNYLFVAPNNTGSTDDNIQTHEESARKKMIGLGSFAEKLGTPLLQPVFPRPKENWKLYTHALDRDTLLTQDQTLKRLDLQLIAMIDDAIARLKVNKISLERKILMYGFSAAGMFTNRFALLHPERIRAAAIGSPGGWAIAPLKKYENQTLRYPIGVSDVSDILKKSSFNARAFQSLNLYFFQGEKDTNDSLKFRDGYEKEDEDLVVKNFGSTLMERWKISEKLYQEGGCRNCRFVLYPETGHSVTNKMVNDIITFFSQAIKQQK